MKNATQMMEETQAIFEKLKDGSIDIKTASEMHNSVGKLMNIARAKLEYHSMRNETPDMDFFK